MATAKGYLALTNEQLGEKIAELNEGRDDDKKIVPEGTTKADLAAALEADTPFVEPVAPEEQPPAEEKGDKKSKTYVVTAPLIAAKVGNTVLHFYKGDILPEGVDKAALDNLKSLGFVAKV